MRKKITEEVLDFIEKRLNQGEKIVIETSKDGIKLSRIKSPLVFKQK